MEDSIKEEMESLKNQIYNAIISAEVFADEHDLGFRLDLEYGMGGYYDGSEQQWYPSSQSC